MVTDRLATTCLLAVLAALRPGAAPAFLALICLDVASHWMQMYATLAAGASSHKVGQESGGRGRRAVPLAAAAAAVWARPRPPWSMRAAPPPSRRTPPWSMRAGNHQTSHPPA